MSSGVGEPGIMHAHEGSLKSLPVPALTDTLAALRHSVLALQSGESAALRRFRAAAAEFESDPSQGPALQSLLEARAGQERNWLEAWWLREAYLRWQEPIACTSSYFMAFDAECHPPLRDAATAEAYYHPAAREGAASTAASTAAAAAAAAAGSTRRGAGKASTSPCAAAAAVIAASTTDYALMVLYERMVPDTAGKAKLCMDQYRYLFSTYRWPGETSDSLGVVSARAMLERAPLYAAVLSRGMVYRVDLTTSGPASKDGQLLRLPISELRASIEAVLRASHGAESDARRRTSSSSSSSSSSAAAAGAAAGSGSGAAAPEPEAVGLGTLTADRRDRWSTNLDALDKESQGAFRAGLRVLEGALFVLCLDDTRVAPSDDTELAQQVFAGDERNRWYDKVLQLLVFANGRVGCIGEHSPMDAGVVSEMIDWCLERTRSGEYHDETSYGASDGVAVAASAVAGGSAGVAATAQESARRVDFGVTRAVAKRANLAGMLSKARSEHSRLRDDVELTTLAFEDFGSQHIKKELGVAPDSFFQVAMQLAYFRTFGKLCATYETSSTRKFFHGRTDVCRSATPEAARFAKSFLAHGRDVSTVLATGAGGSASGKKGHPRASDAARGRVLALRAQLGEALDAHRDFMLKGVKGRAIDRHLLGLRLIAAEREAAGGPAVPGFFSDPCLTESSTWRLSTSTVISRTYTPGFAPVVNDGFGICYSMRKDCIRFGLTAHRSCHATSSAKFRLQIARALHDLRDIVLAARAAAPSDGAGAGAGAGASAAAPAAKL